MKHFPIYLKVADKRICLIGNDDDAVAKARLVAKSEAAIEIYSAMPDESFLAYYRRVGITPFKEVLYHD